MPWNFGKSIVSVTLGTSSTAIEHGLGRNVTGWEIIRINADATIWEDDAPSGSENLNILWLKASATVTVTLKIY